MKKFAWGFGIWEKNAASNPPDRMADEDSGFGHTSLLFDVLNNPGFSDTASAMWEKGKHTKINAVPVLKPRCSILPPAAGPSGATDPPGCAGAIKDVGGTWAGSGRRYRKKSQKPHTEVPRSPREILCGFCGVPRPYVRCPQVERQRSRRRSAKGPQCRQTMLGWT